MDAIWLHIVGYLDISDRIHLSMAFNWNPYFCKVHDVFKILYVLDLDDEIHTGLNVDGNDIVLKPELLEDYMAFFHGCLESLHVRLKTTQYSPENLTLLQKFFRCLHRERLERLFLDVFGEILPLKTELMDAVLSQSDLAGMWFTTRLSASQWMDIKLIIQLYAACSNTDNHINAFFEPALDDAVNAGLPLQPCTLTFFGCKREMAAYAQFKIVENEDSLAPVIRKSRSVCFLWDAVSNNIWKRLEINHQACEEDTQKLDVQITIYRSTPNYLDLLRALDLGNVRSFSLRIINFGPLELRDLHVVLLHLLSCLPSQLKKLDLEIPSPDLTESGALLELLDRCEHLVQVRLVCSRVFDALVHGLCVRLESRTSRLKHLTLIFHPRSLRFLRNLLSMHLHLVLPKPVKLVVLAL